MTRNSRDRNFATQVPPDPSHRIPIFQEPPNDLDESCTYGALVGGLVWRTEPADIARAYRSAADFLIGMTLDDRSATEAVYPVLFLYRHAVELSLKGLFREVPQNHSLPVLIEKADSAFRTSLSADDTDWIRSRLIEFASIDPQSTAFRFAYAKVHGGPRSDGEWWIDFHHLKSTMNVLFDLFDIVTRDGGSGHTAGNSRAPRPRIQRKDTAG